MSIWSFWGEYREYQWKTLIHLVFEFQAFGNTS